MWRNYIKTAWRNLWKNRWYSLINIAGLALGMTTCLLILLFIRYELNYDKFNTRADQIARVVFKGQMNGGEIKEATVMPPVAKTFQDNFPEVITATRLRDRGIPRVTYENKTFREDYFGYADPNFLEVFTIPLIKGDFHTALKEPNNVIISESVAEKFFGDENPIGKMIQVNDQETALQVTGVYKDIPENSHFQDFGFLASMEGLPEAKSNSWMSSNFYTYLLLKKGTDYDKLEQKFKGIVEKYIGPQLQDTMGVTLSQFRKSGNNIGFYLQPLTDIHLHSDLHLDMKPYGEISYIYILSAVGFFMLIIACINFMNLTTAGASRKAKEIGIRKVLGSLRKHLIKQFLIESIVISCIALIFAILLAVLFLPVINSIAGHDLMPALSALTWALPALLLLALITGILAGSYPAFYMSSFNTISILKGKYTSGKSGTTFRNVLVVFQFIISIALIIGTITVFDQLSYIQNKKLGYIKDQVLIVEDSYFLRDKFDVFKDQLQNDPRILQVSSSGYLPAGPSNNNNYLVYPDTKSDELLYSLRYEVDENYLPAMGMKLVAGRNFENGRVNDSTAIIINQATAKELALGENALGHTLSHSENDGSVNTYTIIGIVQDFNFKSLHEKITPLVMTLGNNYNNIIVKFKTGDAGDVEALLNNVKSTWDNLTSEAPLKYSFLDTRFMNTYKSERNIGSILGIFSILTIFVACLGLLGLALFTAEQRKKEIGIRKVLGAKVSNIVSMLLKDFLQLILLSFLIATPVAWYFMNRWLQDFAYRISLGWWIFVLSGILAILIAVVTIGFMAIRTASANPVKSLRSE